jgi:hypothetical protein
MDKPADYRITVQGVVPESWLDRLGGLRIATVANGKTSLEGPLPDQAALKAVLDTLYDLRLSLEEVNCLGPPATCRPGILLGAGE